MRYTYTAGLHPHLPPRCSAAASYTLLHCTTDLSGRYEPNPSQSSAANLSRDHAPREFPHFPRMSRDIQAALDLAGVPRSIRRGRSSGEAKYGSHPTPPPGNTRGAPRPVDGMLERERTAGRRKRTDCREARSFKRIVLYTYPSAGRSLREGGTAHSTT